MALLLEHPIPDFDELRRVLMGEQEPRRVHLVELGIDGEILQAIAERYLDQPWIPPECGESHYKQRVSLFYRLGYDYVPTTPKWLDLPSLDLPTVEDTAALQHRGGQRRFVGGGHGHISCWEDFERFPWDRIRADPTIHDFVARNLPPGMKMTVKTKFFSDVIEQFFGHEKFCYLLYDDPELVRQVVDRWGQIVYDYYELGVSTENVGAIFHGDDLGFKTTTLVAPKVLREYVFPWFKKFVNLAHDHGKMYWYHCDGNVYAGGVIEELIEDVGIDAFHSFQDNILPATDFKARYGRRIAMLGGVDVDNLCRLEEEPLRAYIRNILEQCMPGGRYALGSGNSVTNYVPLENYLIMLEEGRRWRPPS